VQERFEGPPDWTVPGAFPVGPGIHRLPLPLPQDGLRAVNVYVIETGAGLVLIDSGWAIPQSEDALRQGLQSLGYSMDDLRKFLVTHIHSDHYGQAMALRKRYDTEVYLGLGEKESLRDLQQRTPSGPLAEIGPLLQAGAEGLVDEMKALGFSLDVESMGWTDPNHWMNSGDMIELDGRDLEVVATPGHTQGHMVFHDGDLELLFSGDHVLPTITPSIGFEPVRAALPLRSFLDSLTLLLKRPDCILLPAHGAPGGSVHARVHELLLHHAVRLDEIASIAHGRTCTSYEVAEQIKWTRRNRDFRELDAFNQMLAVLETDSHLKLLVATGRLVNTQSDGIDRFSDSHLASIDTGR
jgi:glyoxylase-like metal-dependent hydrolase (beta-lactamase superfamily II)